MENLYEVLGVSETATQDEIKKAFREKSKTSHPDKGGNEEEFKKINNAYSVLSDEGKRREYDNQKNNPFGNFGGGFGGDPFDMFNNFFGGGFRQQKTVNDKIIDVKIGAVDSYTGKNINFNFTRNIKCEPCNGKGGDRHTCGTCNGQGFTVTKTGNSFFANVMRQTCNQCSGKGYTLTNACHVCSGNGTRTEMTTLNINLPKGISDGQFIKAKGYGDYEDGIYGNAILRIFIVEQNGFQKSDNDLIYNLYMSLDDFNKENIPIPHPGGELNITLPNEIDTSKPLRIKGKGYTSGDLYINMFVRHIKK